MNEPEESAVETSIAPRKHKGLPKLLIIIAVVAALFVACGGAVAYFFFDAKSEAGDVEAVVNDFLMKTSSGDVQGAYAHFSSEVTEGLTFAQFRSSVQNTAAYHNVENTKRESWEKSFESGRPTLFSHDATVSYTDGKTRNLHAELIREDNAWKIRFIQIQ